MYVICYKLSSKICVAVQKLYKKGLAFRLKLYAECYVPKLGKKFVQKESTKGGVHPFVEKWRQSWSLCYFGEGTLKFNLLSGLEWAGVEKLGIYTELCKARNVSSPFSTQHGL